MANTVSSSLTSSPSDTAWFAGQAGLFPAPSRSGASTWNCGDSWFIRLRHCAEVLAFE
jgi:hypothetical protein